MYALLVCARARMCVCACVRVSVCARAQVCTHHRSASLFHLSKKGAMRNQRKVHSKASFTQQTMYKDKSSNNMDLHCL